MDHTFLELRKRTLQCYKDSLAWVELQIAQHGGDMEAPLELLHQREEIKRQIEKLEKELGEYASGDDPCDSGCNRRPTYTDALVDMRVEMAKMRQDYIAQTRNINGRLDEITSRLEQHEHRLGRIEGYLRASSAVRFNNGSLG